MERIKHLENMIQLCRELYYNNGASPLSDVEYDALEEELKRLDPNNSLLNSIGSYSMKNKIKHVFRMYSLDKIHTIDELGKFYKQYQGCGIDVMRKYDGLSIEAVYINGRLVQLSTRGDGKYGESVIRHSKYISGLPHNISEQGLVCVYGECYISKKDFEEIKKNSSDDEDINDARNLAVGTLGCDDPEIVKSRKLRFVAYKVAPFNGNFEEQINFLNKEGFNTAELIKEVKMSLEEMEKISNDCDCGTDGLVFMISDKNKCEELGFTVKHPRFAVALKFKDESVKTIVEDIELSISRNGTLSPVAIIKEVVIDKAKITRVSMTNIDNMQLKNVVIGSEVDVVRANKVIPKIISGELPEGCSEYTPPKECPYCKHPITISKSETGIRTLKCANGECPGMLAKVLEHWCDNMRIDNMGEANCLKVAKDFIEFIILMEESIQPLNIIIYFHNLSEYDLSKTLKSKVIGKKVYSSMKEREKGCRKVDFIAALGIDSFGRNSYERLSTRYDIFEMLLFNNDKLDKKIFGDKVSENMQKWLDTNFEEVSYLKSRFVFESVGNSNSNKNGKLSGLSICITGTLSKPRKYFEDLIKDNGGSVASSVTKKTDYLIAGDDCGSKLQKAESLGVKILSENDFGKMIN